MVDVTWTNTEFEADEIDIPTKEGSRFIGTSLGMHVLSNKVTLSWKCRCQCQLAHSRLPLVTRVMTTTTPTMTMAATTIMLVAQVAVHEAVWLSATTVHREA
jgi:hypothetical protein